MGHAPDPEPLGSEARDFSSRRSAGSAEPALKWRSAAWNASDRSTPPPADACGVGCCFELDGESEEWAWWSWGKRHWVKLGEVEEEEEDDEGG